MKERAKKLELEGEKEYTFPTVITGGNPPADENWLAALSQGTVFVTRPKEPPKLPTNLGGGGLKEDARLLGLAELHVVFKAKTITKLLENINGPNNFFWVDTLRFSRKMELVEIIGEV